MLLSKGPFTYDCINVELRESPGLLPLLVKEGVDAVGSAAGALPVVVLLLGVVVRVVLQGGQPIIQIV